MPPSTRRANAAFNEAPLHFVHEGEIVHAAVDRLVIREREVLVIVYDTRQDAARSDLEQLARTHRERLRLWTEGVRELWPDRTVRALVLFTACAAIVELKGQP
jgi:ATP-dependent helicase/nuclease subunit A